MTAEEARYRVMSRRPIPLLFLRFCIPALIALIVQNFYSVADMIIVSRGGDGTLSITAIGLYYPLETAVLAISLGLGIGANAVISIHIGAREMPQACRVLGNTVLMLAGLSLFLPLVTIFALPRLFTIMGAQEDTLPHALAYAHVLVPMMWANLTLVLADDALRADNHPNVAMLIQIASAAINVGLDLILIIGFDMGTKGCAIATAAAYGVPGLGVMVFFCLRGPGRLRLTVDSLRPDWTAVVSVIRAGFGMFVNIVGWSCNAFVANTLINALCPSDMVGPYIAGTQGVMRAMMIIQVPLIAIAQGQIPIVGFSYGARRYRRLVSAFIFSSVIATVFAIIGQVIMQGMPALYLRLFTNDGPTIRAGTEVARIAYGGWLVVGFNICVQMTLMAVNRGALSIWLTTARHYLVNIPSMLTLAALSRSYSVVLLATPISDYSGFVLSVVALILAAGWITKEARATKRAKMSVTPSEIERGEGEEELSY